MNMSKGITGKIELMFINIKRLRNSVTSLISFRWKYGVTCYVPQSHFIQKLSCDYREDYYTEFLNLFATTYHQPHSMVVWQVVYLLVFQPTPDVTSESVLYAPLTFHYEISSDLVLAEPNNPHTSMLHFNILFFGIYRTTFCIITSYERNNVTSVLRLRSSVYNLAGWWCSSLRTSHNSVLRLRWGIIRVASS